MGGAASAMFSSKKPKKADTSQGGNKGIQDDARSFYSKASAIKLLIRGDVSRQAFRSYLEQTNSGGEVEYLDYYMTVDGIKKSRDKSAVAKRVAFVDLVKEYEKKAETKVPAAVAIYLTMHCWQGIDAITDEEVAKLMSRSQEEILAILTPNFENFVASKQYAEWTKAQNTMERRNSFTGNNGKLPEGLKINAAPGAPT